MIPDPTTKDGLEEAHRRVNKTKEYAKDMHDLARENPDEEPSGKVTQPSEIDLHRDRKDDE